MKIRIIAVIIIIFSFFELNIYPAAEDVGTTSNNFLKILAPAKPAAMSGAYIALPNDIHTIRYNPAGLGKSMLSEISASHLIWLEGVGYENINFMTPFSFGNMAFSIRYLHMDEMDKTIASASPEGYDTLYSFSPFVFDGSVSYAKKFADNFFVGANFSLIDYAIDPEAESGSSISFVVGLGLIYDMPFLKGASAGLVFRDLGPPSSFIEEGFMPPLNMRAGIGYRHKMFGVEADIEVVNDNDINFYAGGEVTPIEALSLRAGYRGGIINQFSAGAGVSYNNIYFDYAFVPFSDEGLGMTHRATITYKFGSPPLKIKAQPAVFSPNRDKYLDFTFIRPDIKMKDRVTSMTLRILDSYGAPVRIWPVKPGTRIFWNGYTDALSAASDGSYWAVLDVDYGKGINSTSNREEVAVDNTPPRVRVDASPKKVRPGSITTLMAPVRFTPRVYDLHGIGKWKLVIVDSSGRVFKQFSGRGSPGEIIWDGTDNTGMNSVDTGSVYTYALYAWDTVGNGSRSPAKKVKVLLREVVITLGADTLFDPGKADVKISVYKDLKKIADRIKDYKKVSVLVTGHTDNRPVRHSVYRNNKELSEYRARAVVEFFVELFDIDRDIFTSRGMGASKPVAANTTAEGRKKNRRVTIRMKASTWE